MEDVPYSRIFREGWAFALVGAIVGGLLAYGISQLLPKSYISTSTLILQVEAPEAALYQGTQFTQARVKAYPRLIENPTVVDGLREDLDLDSDTYSDRDIRRMLSATSLSDTPLVEVSAEAPTPRLAADMANAASLHFATLIEEFENEAAGTNQAVQLLQVVPAVPPTYAASPQTIPIVGLGLIAGLAAGTIFAIYRTTSRRRLTTPADIHREVGLPVVGQVPKRSRFVSSKAREAAYFETASNILALAGGSTTDFMLVPTSPDPLDTDSLSGLMQGFFDAGYPTVVLDTRQKSPTSESSLELEQALAGSQVRSAEIPTGIYSLTAPTPGELIASLASVLNRLSAEGYATVIVVDPGASTVISAVDVPLILAVQARKTKLTDVLAVASRIKVMGIRPLGVLVAGARGHGDASYQTWQEADSSSLRTRHTE